MTRATTRLRDWLVAGAVLPMLVKPTVGTAAPAPGGVVLLAKAGPPGEAHRTPHGAPPAAAP